MKINKLYSIILLFMMGTLVSCMEESDFDKVWDGSEVEFDASTLPNGVTQNFVRLNATQTDQANLQINLVGAAQSTPVTVTVEADPTSTAVQGVHYTLASNTVTIPAGQVIAQLPVTVLTGNIQPTETPNLVLNITSANGAKVSVNYKSLTYRIRVICPSALVGSYTVLWRVLNLGDGSGGVAQTATNFTIAAFPTISLTSTATGVYTMSDMSFGMYPGLYQDTAPTGTFTDRCNVLTGASTNRDRYNDPFTITGTSTPADGKILITWKNTYGDGGTVELTKRP
ncbi:MAG: hypothetical protein Q8S14_01650 [Algoriphagus sp.]|jgi:hypothetical protein|uniref:DUF4843 domain-containing protein n=1 Tax=Algoriphagus sp. TaxID=1872435 RepID=UPI00271892C0|nr:DUF4843 domain-containing protein [Algoriphagus sp.]MDO8967953.1 hypothetical protein [Algoriphagus sp.]MDP2040996.1 hypothetical protein [Algoriphagus sp.]MDP3200475.1 hypothetical protein [Algoriphagus sp.]MDP3470548.1 hypothetical protein [Algoriphagus sp.]